MWNAASRSGLRLVASSSARARRAACDLGPPVDLGDELGGGDELLGGIAFVAAVHVGGGDGDEMGQGRQRHLACAHARGQAPLKVSATRVRAEQVHLDGAVQGRVEGHRRRRVDHDVTGRRADRGPASSRPSPSLPDVAGDRVEPAGDHVVEAPAELAAEPVEAVVAQDLAPSALGRTPGAGPGGRARRPRIRARFGASRSTSAVPRKPVAPVTAIRRPASSSGITGVFLAPGCPRSGRFSCGNGLRAVRAPDGCGGRLRSWSRSALRGLGAGRCGLFRRRSARRLRRGVALVGLGRRPLSRSGLVVLLAGLRLPGLSCAGSAPRRV